MTMLKVTTKGDNSRYINPDFIRSLKDIGVTDRKGSIIFLQGSQTGITVKETPEQVTLMIAALTWKPDTIHVEWEDKTNRPAIITAERNFTEYVQKPTKED